MTKASKSFWWPFLLQVFVFVDVLGVRQHFKEVARPTGVMKYSFLFSIPAENFEVSMCSAVFTSVKYMPRV